MTIRSSREDSAIEPTTVVASGRIDLHDEEMLFGDLSLPIPLSDKEYLIYIPVVAVGEQRYATARVVLMLFNRDQNAITQQWLSPPCLHACLAPGLKVIARPHGKEVRVTLNSLNAKRLHRLLWRGNSLQRLDQ